MGESQPKAIPPAALAFNVNVVPPQLILGTAVGNALLSVMLTVTVVEHIPGDAVLVSTTLYTPAAETTKLGVVVLDHAAVVFVPVNADNVSVGELQVIAPFRGVIVKVCAS